MDPIWIAILALGQHAANLYVAERVRDADFNGVIAAVARHPDEVEELRTAGVDVARDFMTEAGTGLAEHAYEALKNR